MPRFSASDVRSGRRVSSSSSLYRNKSSVGRDEVSGVVGRFFVGTLEGVSDRVSVTGALVGIGFGDVLIGMALIGVAVAIGIGVHVGVGIGVGDGGMVMTVDVERGLHAVAQVITTSATVAATFRATNHETCFTRLNVRLL